jgi:hypothetical protein
MQATLKNLKVNTRLSEETYCFSASLYIDGKRRGDVTNRGHGGPHEFSDLSAQRELDEWGKKQPPIESFGMQLPLDADLSVGDLIDKEMLARDRKTMTRKLLRKLKHPRCLVIIGIAVEEREVRATGERVVAGPGAMAPPIKRLASEGYTCIEVYAGASGHLLETVTP